MVNRVKLIVLDVDGVLTDGKLFIGSDGNEYKAFNCLDGMGISLAKFAGIKFAIITGRKSESVRKRAEELKIDFVYQGVKAKKLIVDDLIDKLKIEYKEVCCIGDDLNDLPMLEIAGISASPSNAVDIVKKRVDYVATKGGGDGAVREIIDKILRMQNDYESLVNKFSLSKKSVIQ